MRNEKTHIENKKVGRKPSVTLEQVVEAAKELQSQNRAIIGWSLRSVLGEGGPKYLINLWEDYANSQGMYSDKESDSSIDDHVLTPELEAKVNLMLGNISQQLNSFALESDHLANHMAQKKAKTAYESLMLENNQLKEELDLGSSIIENLDEKIEKLNTEIESLIIQIKDLTQNEYVFENRISNLLEIQGKAAENLENMQKEFKHEQNKSLELIKSETKLKTQVEMYIAAKEESIAKLEEAQSTINQLNLKILSLEQSEKAKSEKISHFEQIVQEQAES